MPLDVLFALALPLPLVLCLGLICITVVGVVALRRAHPSDTVAVVRALPELAATFLRYRRRTRR
ncbi:hypothetical protein [Streptomyces fradiae]|uniref:hypothetical protein n=1 Tax=Streptomyces fradiae TaxID=1906 RepID=UPI0029424E8C|nr:hypothetical protein [Streptomyces fradiae]WOI60880.1 hypothetical protein RYQ63_13775 [Streptomyces fradiae]WOI60936.1 hypothetical protein RYQ63_14075 [Streptomyces fradiae]